jgi:hypothetical protein
VFIGPNVVFTDEPQPMGYPRYRECKGGAVVRRLARIGADCTILPGVGIGEMALVGALTSSSEVSRSCSPSRRLSLAQVPKTRIALRNLTLPVPSAHDALLLWLPGSRRLGSLEAMVPATCGAISLYSVTRANGPVARVQNDQTGRWA